MGIRNRPMGIRNRPLGIRNRPLGIRNRPLGIRNRPRGIQNRPLQYSTVQYNTYTYLHISLHISTYLYISPQISTYLYISLQISTDLYISLQISTDLYISLYISTYLYRSLHNLGLRGLQGIAQRSQGRPKEILRGTRGIPERNPKDLGSSRLKQERRKVFLHTLPVWGKRRKGTLENLWRLSHCGRTVSEDTLSFSEKHEYPTRYINCVFCKFTFLV